MAASAELTAEMDARATWVNIESGGVVEAATTLDGFYSYWVISMLDYPYQLSTNDPLTAAWIWGMNFLNAHPGVDGSQLNELSQAYGNFLQAAMNGQPLPALPPPPFSTQTGGIKTIPGVVHSDTPPIPPPPAPIDQSVPNPALAALMTTGAPAPTPAAAPAPAPVDTTTNPYAGVTVSPKGVHAMSYAGAGEGVGGVGLGVGLAAAGVTFGISIVASIVVDLLSSLFGGSDTKALQQSINKVAQAQAQIADELERFSWSIAVGLGRLWQAIAGIWDNFLDGLWTYMKRLWNLLWTVVSQVIPKMIQVMRDLRKFLDHIYTTYILKAMRYLLLVRQVLLVLRALHIPIAARLDKILGQIQSALFLPFGYLLRSLNGYGGWFNFILTSRLILQRPLFINTMYAYQADWINMFYTAQSGQQGPVGTLGPAATGTSSFANWLSDAGAAAGSTDTTQQVMTTAEACAWITVFATTGSGELADTAQKTLVLLDQYLGI